MRRLDTVLLLSAAAALAACAAPARLKPAAETVRRQGRQGLINPLLDVEPSADSLELETLQRRVEDLIRRRERSGLAEQASVYYRDLNGGLVFGIDDQIEYAPASLLKVPVMIAVFQRAQEEPGLLDRSVVYRPDLDTTAEISTRTLESGRAYPVSDLMRAMIVDSDNGAARTLWDVAGAGAIEKVYVEEGVPDPWVRARQGDSTVREYAAFFRMLYNASYLGKTYSERALDLLAKSDYPYGLVAGVPAGTTVAHKFGERGLRDGRKQLHDCGIVYHPSQPYVLCVMTRGRDFGALARMIRDISAATWAEVESPAYATRARR